MKLVATVQPNTIWYIIARDNFTPFSGTSISLESYYTISIKNFHLSVVRHRALYDVSSERCYNRYCIKHADGDRDKNLYKRIFTPVTLRTT